MNTDTLLQFFKGPVVAAMGTVGRDGKPSFLRILGVHGAEGTNLLRAVFSRGIAQETLADLEENPAGALTVADITTMQSRQFKGKVSVEETNAADMEAVEASMKASTAPVGAFFGPGAGKGWERMFFPPYGTFVLEYNISFDQTPGPDAGKELQ